jgi:hypothetical protein
MTFTSRAAGLLVIAAKVVLLTVVMFVVVSAAMTITGVAGDPAMAGRETAEVDQATSGGDAAGATPPGPVVSSAADEGDTAMIFLAVCLLQTIALSVVVLRSRWRGWRLVLAIFALMVVVTAVVSHIDSLFFLRDLSRSFIAKMALASTLAAAFFAPVAVWVLGRFQKTDAAEASSQMASWSVQRWAAILLVLTVLHIVTYFAFGYYVAWQSTELRAFYEGEDPGSFWLQMVSVARDTPGLLPVQLVRGVLWGLMALLLASSLTGARWSAALITAGVFVALFALPLVIPNPFMPEAVRKMHLIETVLSRGLYGFVAVWIVRPYLQPAGLES